MDVPVKKSRTWYYCPSIVTGKSPTAWHTFKMVFIGNEVKASLDGTQYFDVTDSTFGALGASSVALMNGGNRVTIRQCDNKLVSHSRQKPEQKDFFPEPREIGGTVFNPVVWWA